MDKTKNSSAIYSVWISVRGAYYTAVIRDAVDAVGGLPLIYRVVIPRESLTQAWTGCRAKELNYQQRRERCPTGHYMQLTTASTKWMAKSDVVLSSAWFN